MKDKPTAYWSPEAQQKHLPWNYAVMVADGAVYMAGLAFVSQESVLPNMIRELGGADWMIALSPSFLLIGSMMTPLLLVHHVEKLRVYGRFTFKMSLMQRTIPLLSALALLFFWTIAPGPSLYLAALTPLIMGICGGLGSTSFWQLYSKIIPQNRRSSNNAWRNSLGLLVGVLAGAVISGVLTHHPGPTGYGILFLLQFAGVALSGVFFYMIRELPDPPHEARPHRSFKDVIRGIPEALRSDKAFSRFLWARALGQAHFIIIPFLALHFRNRLGLPESFLGNIVQAQMAGGLLGNLIAGYWGDRSGAKKPLCLARVLALILCAMACWVHTASLALTAFFLVGMIVNILNTSEYMLLLELSTAEKLPSLVAVQSIVLMPVTLLFGLISKWLFQATGDVSWHGLVAGIFLLVSFLLLLRLPVPRHSAPKSAS